MQISVCDVCKKPNVKLLGLHKPDDKKGYNLLLYRVEGGGLAELCVSCFKSSVIDNLKLLKVK